MDGCQASLLFYSLLVGNTLFLDTTLARGDVEMLFIPLLQQLYHTDRIRSSRQLYVLVIILLILTQDSAFNVGRWDHSPLSKPHSALLLQLHVCSDVCLMPRRRLRNQAELPPHLLTQISK